MTCLLSSWLRAVFVTERWRSFTRLSRRGSLWSLIVGLILMACASLAAAQAPSSTGGAVGGKAPLRKMTPWEIAARINFTPQCTHYAIVGYCYCGYTPCAWMVIQFVPVSFIETTRYPGDTMVAALDFSQLTVGASNAFPGLTRQINQSGMDNSFENHNYSIPEKIYRQYTVCMMCEPKHAEAPYINKSGGLLGTGAASSVCGSVTNMVNKYSKVGDIGGGFDGYNMKLFYASEPDALNWRTGCRDMSLTHMLTSNAFTCTAAGIASFAGSPELITNLIGEDSCIGNWGPLYPRQMRARGPTQVQSAAIAAYRGISIARTEMDRFPYPVDTTGKLQQAYPNISACTKVGTIPLPTSMKPSLDGALGWIYWRPTGCCIPFNAYATCYGT